MRLERSISTLALGLWLLVGTVTPAASRGEEAQYPETRKLIELVARAAELVESQGQAACDAFKQKDGGWLHGDVYVFVVDFEGKAHCHPERPALEGQSLFDLHDADGKPIMKLMLRQLAAGADDGWVHYLWPRPRETVQSWKSTYLRRATSPDDGTELIVASGAYNLPLERLFIVDRVEEASWLLETRGEAAFDTLRSKAGGFLFLDAYIFVMNSEGVMLVHPFSPGLEGTNSLDVRGAEGVYPGREMLNVLETADSGWVEYYWPRPRSSEPVFKETYVRRVDLVDGFLVVGSGVYVD